MSLKQDHFVAFGEKSKKDKEYWLNTLAKDYSVIGFSSDKSAISFNTYERGNISYEFPKEINEGIQKLSNKSDYGNHLILLSGILYLIHRYTGNTDIIAGSPIIREKSVNSNNNILPIRVKIEVNESYKSFLREIQATVVKANEHKSYPINQLNGLEEGFPYSTIVELQNIHNVHYEERTKADMVLSFQIINDCINCSIEYSQSLYTPEMISRMYGHLTNFYNCVINDVNVKLKNIEIMPAMEKQHIIYDFNNTKVSYSYDKTIYDLFEEQVKRTPENIAVQFENKQITYKELNEKSNQLARILRRKGVKADSLIAILAERSLEMIIGILGILKAGGAYLPIDPICPQDRIEYMLMDSQSDLLLTTEKFSTEIKFSGEIMNLLEVDFSPENTENLVKINNPDDLVYVIYTSGTTGNPKGTIVKHHSFTNLAQWYCNEFKMSEKDNVLLMASVGFDLAQKNIYAPLIMGGKLTLANKGMINYEKTIGIIEGNEITIINCAPSAFNPIVHLNKDSNFEALKGLKYIFLGGEIINLSQLSTWISSGNCNAEIVNTYGPTECSDIATFYRIKSTEVKYVPIGKPINNIRVYILNEDNQILPIGVPGHLYIAGEGLSRGYLNKAELTAEKFVENPFECDRKMYRTGDLARWLPNGNVEFLGRLDHQIKIRGYRVELEEIESNLVRIEGIKEAAVLDKEEGGNKYLCGFYSSEKEYSKDELRGKLVKNLPDYMIPLYFVKLDQLPINQNGKIDRKLLSTLEITKSKSKNYINPRNDLEKEIRGIWIDILDISDIGIEDNLFQIGGHSLRAIVLASRLGKKFNVEISVRDIFDNPTIRELADYINSSAKKEYVSMEAVGERDYYPISPAEKRMFVLNQIEKNGTGYNIPLAIAIEGDLDKKKFQEALQSLVSRHDILRTYFSFVDGEPVQTVVKDLKLNLEFYILEEYEIKAKIEEFVRQFNLEKAPLIRVALIELSKEKHVFLLDVHHIIFDGYSTSIFMKELSDLYRGKELPDLRIQYKDYSVWQNNLIEQGHIKKEEEYWLKTFEGELPVLNLRLDFSRPTIQSFEGDNITLVLNKKLTNNLKRISVETGSTMYMVLLSAVNIVLSRYSGQEDIVIGTPIMGRQHPDLEKVIGMFVNTLAMRNHPEGSKTYLEFLKEVRENALRAYENQNYQFEELVNKLSLPRDLSKNPLFDVVFTMETLEDSSEELDIGLKFKGFDYGYIKSKFDLSFSAAEKGEQLFVNLEYCTKLFRRETIERLGLHLTNILKTISEDANIKLSSIDMNSKDERNTILKDFNNTYAEFPSDRTIHKLFEKQVERLPDHIAVVFKDKQLTYRELNNKANSLASFLRGKGVKAEVVVGIMVEKSLEMIIGMLGILKAGGAYLPIDKDYPEDRINYMLEDSNTSIVLTQKHFRDMIHSCVEIIDLEDEQLYEGEKRNLNDTTTSNNLAYVIYTSGTTGKPKGVMVEHQSLVNLCTWHNAIHEITDSDKTTRYTGFGFDVSVWEVFPYIIAGAAIYIIDSSIMLDPNALNIYYEANGITISYLPTQICEQFMDLDNSSLRKLLTGSEKLTTIYRELNYQFVNNYGPTENAVITTSFIVDKEYNNIPIGKPISNCRVYILDKYDNLCPIGVAGELCISGIGLARGYLNNKKLTEEKFVVNPNESGQRMYRTGDMARWLADGNIEFLGRIDQQVKIRGFRIELGEIESQLLKVEGLKAAIVLDKGEGENRFLCAYYLSDIEFDTSIFKEKLRKSLPEYMIPSFFIKIDSIPLTSNGKVDRKSLLQIQHNLNLTVKYKAPRNEMDKRLQDVWKKTLFINEIGIDDDFFELGGHSLKAIALSMNVSKDINFNIAVTDIFINPTIRELSDYILQSDNSEETYQDNNITLLKKVKGANKNLFLIHEVSGSVDSYIGFAQQIERECNCWGISFNKDENCYPKNLEVRTLASEYINVIKRVQPEGPYYVAGWSCGGTIAFEIVRQIEESKEKVAFLGIIDSVAPDINVNKQYGKFDIETEKQFLIGLLGESKVSVAIENSNSVEEMYELTLNDSRKVDVNIQPDYKEILTNVYPYFEEMELKELISRINVFRSIIEACIQYIPETSIKTKIHYFKAMQSLEVDEKRWNEYSKNTINTYLIEGNHFSIFRLPQISKLAEHFNKVLDEMQVLLKA